MTRYRHNPSKTASFDSTYLYGLARFVDMNLTLDVDQVLSTKPTGLLARHELMDTDEG
jgi:hypothetical protein